MLIRAMRAVLTRVIWPVIHIIHTVTTSIFYTFYTSLYLHCTRACTIQTGPVLRVGCWEQRGAAVRTGGHGSAHRVLLLRHSGVC